MWGIFPHWRGMIPIAMGKNSHCHETYVIVRSYNRLLHTPIPLSRGELVTTSAINKDSLLAIILTISGRKEFNKQLRVLL